MQHGASVTDGSRHDVGHIQVRLATGSFTDTNSFISELDMKSLSINSRMNSDTLNAHLMRSANDTHSNLASIRHKNLLILTNRRQSTPIAPRPIARPILL
jgi:hypothetical protein